MKISIFFFWLCWPPWAFLSIGFLGVPTFKKLHLESIQSILALKFWSELYFGNFGVFRIFWNFHFFFCVFWLLNVQKPLGNDDFPYFLQFLVFCQNWDWGAFVNNGFWSPIFLSELRLEQFSSVIMIKILLDDHFGSTDKNKIFQNCKNRQKRPKNEQILGILKY